MEPSAKQSLRNSSGVVARIGVRLRRTHSAYTRIDICKQQQEIGAGLDGEDCSRRVLVNDRFYPNPLPGPLVPGQLECPRRPNKSL